MTNDDLAMRIARLIRDAACPFDLRDGDARPPIRTIGHGDNSIIVDEEALADIIRPHLQRAERPTAPPASSTAEPS